MNKFYINDSNGRKYYAYKYERDEVKYISLERKNISLLLSSISKDKIRNIRDKDKYMEIVFENGLTLIIDNLRIFKPHQDNDDKYFQILLTKLKSFVEKETLKKYKATLPPNHIPKVNRTRKKEIPKRRIIAGALSLALTASLIAGLINKEMATAKELSPFENTTISYTIPSVESNKKEVNNEIIIKPVKDNSIKVDLAFPDETANGKLEQTIELCAPYLDEWIERYGLPRDLTYALVSQEYGLLDCSINAGGACGPMQLQVSSFHNDNAIECVKVPVYENGEFTGEYDEFYVADARHLDDPRLAGKNYLVMQNLEDNFRIGCAQLRRCIDKYKNIFIAVDAYNKGMYAMSNVCSEDELNYYENNLEDFSWVNLIPNHYGENYGDKDYIWHVLRYLDTGTRGEANIEYNYKDELIKVDLTNTNVYNNELGR